jgi:hypothetical protein
MIERGELHPKEEDGEIYVERSEVDRVRLVQINTVYRLVLRQHI